MVAKRFYKSLRYEETKTDQDWVDALQIFADVSLDPDISSPIDGQVLTYDVISQRWTNKTLPPYPVLPVFAKGAALSVIDGGTIAHGLSTTPTTAFVQSTVAGEFASVTAISSTTITVAIKKHDNITGTTQTIYWRAEV